VRFNYGGVRVTVRYLLPSDEVKDGDERVSYQMDCARSINRIADTVRRFSNASYIDPRLTFRHSYVTFIPASATVVWVQCRLTFLGKQRWWHWKRRSARKNAQRGFKVPVADASSARLLDKP
jgi:hypothetical protein